MKRDIQILTGQVLAADCRKTIAQATPRELYNAVSKAALDLAADAWKRAPGKRVAYLSAEFLVGRLVYANLLNMGRLGEVQQMLLDAGVDANVFEEIEDAALGNGGLGRLAACFLDSAATQGVPATASGTSTACSGSILRMASRKRPPMTGSALEIHGAFAGRRMPSLCSSAGRPCAPCLTTRLSSATE